MRIISLFAFILVSTSLLSESNHHAEAIGVDSASHGSLYGGRVVRRYGAGRFIYRGLQGRAEPVPKDNQDNKGPAPKDPKAQPKEDNDPPKVKDPKAKDQDPVKDPKAKDQDPPKDPNPLKDPNPPKDPNPLKDPNPPKDPNPLKEPKDQKGPKDLPPKDPGTPKSPSVKVPAQKNDSKTADDTTDNTLPKDDKDDPDQQDQAAEQAQSTPRVNTGPISAAAMGGLAAVGGVFILVGGLFAFSQKRKNNEMTKSIVTSSAKAWEQQNSAYEIMEEETKPIGTYPVIATYTPNLADELDIQPGDTVTILVEYDDGWVQGINETRGGIKGVFPRHCVDMDRASNKVHKNNKRSSSMGVYTEKYTEVDLS